ncbi:MAG TPA: alkaline phosphatase [Tenuifilaceae bacterium]|nr:alkaline phosphatase [Tenuifilaceae bacterium]HPI46017.1 alkaline phosphatase [Tenuifilaceae bacterium]
MRIKLLLSFLVISVVLNSCNISQKNYKAKYVFLFIGDGMGIQQVNMAQLYADSVLRDPLGVVFTKFPVTGISTTHAATRYITCSAAAGTALSTGTKTSIGTIGLNADHTDTLFSIAKQFKEAGRKVAILTSVSIDHATPAAFYAHKGSRSSYYEIAKDLLVSNYDFFASGGFVEPYGSKKDSGSVPIYQLGAERGINFTQTFSGVDSLLNVKTNSIVYSVPNPAPSSTLLYEIDRADSDITLEDITRKAIEVVDNPNGFFMMVEGGKIDWACHDNDAATVINEVLAFSRSVNAAFEFYKKHPNETLIIVTADHETGGMSLGNEANGYKNFLSILRNQKMSQEKLHQTIENYHNGNPNASFNQVMDIIQQNTGLSLTGGYALSPEELEQLRQAYNLYFGVKQTNNSKNEYSKTDLLVRTALSILNKKAGIGWTSGTHTGSPVPIFVIGEGQALFNHFMDNTDIPKNILKSTGIKK